MKTSPLSGSLQEYLPVLEKKLKDSLRTSNPYYSLIYEAASYSLSSPGKRIRPLLLLATVEAFDSSSLQKALIPACSVEMIHTYSLIHDDLPCMDDDDLRRGKPSLHKVYPEGQALLAGDLLLTLAFETLATIKDLTPLQIVEMIKVLSVKSGGEGMIGGQSLDLLSEGKTISWEALEAIHQGKTAALLSACLEIGGIIAGVSPSIRGELVHIGKKIGLSFQIIDDILDVEGDVTLLGKPLLSDKEKEKSTSVSLLGIESAKNLAEELLTSALEKCQNLGIGNSSLATLLPHLVHRSF